MKRKTILTVLSLIVLLALLSLGGVAMAAATPTLDWWVIGGGGGHAEAGDFAIDTTVGQAVAGIVGDGSYDLCTGFWCGIGGYQVYLPLILRGG